MNMSQREDQELPPDICRPNSTNNGCPPPLPPRRQPASQSPYVQDTRPYGDTYPHYYPQPLTHSWSAQDPRSSSTQSLVPEEHPRDDKRTLLLVYIHGFMGNETSFQSFPAHIHNLVTVKLADTHRVHTKIYPRYKSRKAIEYARDDFSKWLCPHESSDTDVVLIGHSMGGILSAEVVLLASHFNDSMQSDKKLLRHRIVGTINFDTPFLGMHPGIIPSGIGSLFRPALDTPAADAPGTEVQEPMKDSTEWPNVYHRTPEMDYLPDSSSSTLVATKSRTSNVGSLSPVTSPVNDPNFNPPFPNDVRMATRTGWGNALHFINKHSDSLVRATRSYVTSYFEFGGCLADYKGLKDRYFRLRTLEETDSRRRNGQMRVRFTNYYTASTGRPKKSKLPSKVQESEQASIDSSDARKENALTESETRISMESDHDDSLPLVNPGCPSDKGDNSNLETSVEDDDQEPVQVVNSGSISNQEDSSKLASHISVVNLDLVSDNESLGDTLERNDRNAVPIQDLTLENRTSNTNSNTVGDPTLERSTSITRSLSTPPSLPPIPAQPQEPAAFDPSKYPEKDARKLAEKEHSRQTKAYERAVKDRDRAIKDRRKLLERREKAAKRALEKQLKLEAKEIAKVKKEEEAAASAAASASKKARDEEAGPGDERSGSKDMERNGLPDEEEAKPEKAKRDRKFCMLPPRINGERDACWVRVYMPGVDEVGAHCGLFFVGEQYEWLVSDVGRRIQEWVECK